MRAVLGGKDGAADQRRHRRQRRRHADSSLSIERNQPGKITATVAAKTRRWSTTKATKKRRESNLRSRCSFGLDVWRNCTGPYHCTLHRQGHMLLVTKLISVARSNQLVIIALDCSVSCHLHSSSNCSFFSPIFTFPDFFSDFSKLCAFLTFPDQSNSVTFLQISLTCRNPLPSKNSNTKSP